MPDRARGRAAQAWAALTRWGGRALLVLAVPAGHLVRALPGLLAFLLLAYGAWLIYPPAGFLTAGALLLGDRLATARAVTRQKRGES